MHIGMDARMPAYRQGGISQYIVQLLAALAGLDTEHQYTVFHSRKDRVDRRPPGGNFRRRNLWTPPHHRWERWALAAELWPHRLDLLHSPDSIPPAGGARRRVITVHDLNYIYFPGFMTQESRRYYQGQIAWAVREANHIVADSEQTRQDLIDRLAVPPDKVTTVHLAANPLFARPVPEPEIDAVMTRYGLPRGFILFVGTIEPRKNLIFLLEVYAGLRLEWPDIPPLVLAGSSGWLIDPIFDALGLSENVYFLEGVSDAELSAAYRAAAVLALPSHYEGFGLPVLEAMHAGCPVVCSDRGSLPEIAGGAARLVDATDEAGWAAALVEVLSDSDLRARMIAQGRQQAARFSWPQTARQTLAVYEKVAAM